MKHIWTDEETNTLLELKQKDIPSQIIAEKLCEEYGNKFTYDSVRKRYERVKRNEKAEKGKLGYKEVTEMREDGSIYSDKLIELSEKQEKDKLYILKEHGYDPDEWEVTKFKTSAWHYRDKESDNPKISYATQLWLKPKQEDTDFKKLIEVIENQKPFNIKISNKPIDGEKLLEIAPVDPHFGISSYENYIPNQERIIQRIRTRRWSEIVIPIGNDLFHNDDFRGRTSSGREIQKVNMDKAWDDAKKFYYPIINESIDKSNKVTVIYVPGNHSESMAWAFVKNVMTKYPTLTFDDKFNQHKAHIFHEVFIGLTHGDKNRKNTTKIYNSKFRMEIAKAKVREIHMAHLHGEDASTQDDYGIMLRTLPTQNKEDEWHDQNGYVGKNKRFVCFEYSKDAIEGMYYV